MNEANINKFIEERIKKVSSEFEIDLIRLLKTNSYISNLGNLTKENSNYIKFKLTEIKDTLRQFSNKLYEVERSLNFQTEDTPDQKNIELFDDLRSEITNHQNSINAILANIENDERDITNKIDTLFKHYSLEIEATQKELDYRLNSLQKELIEFTPTSTVKEVLVEKKQEQVVGDTGLNEDTTVNKKVFNEAIIYVIVLVVLGALILIGIINLKDKKSIISRKILDTKDEKINNEQKGNYINNIDTPKSEEKKLTKNNAVDNGSRKSSQFAADKLNKDSKEMTKVSNLYKNNLKYNPMNLYIKNVGTPKSEDKKLTKINAVDNGSRKNSQFASETVEINKPVQKPDFLMVKGVGANVREGPGINYPVVFIVESGQKFIDLNEKKGIWLKIKMNDSREGWISSKLINARVY